MSFKAQALNSLMLKAAADRAEAMTSLEIMLDHPAGIGDHSTGDLHNNLNEALSGLADAEDRIETLKRNFGSWLPLNEN
jgi:hypothetical protein